ATLADRPSDRLGECLRQLRSSPPTVQGPRCRLVITPECRKDLRSIVRGTGSGGVENGAVGSEQPSKASYDRDCGKLALSRRRDCSPSDTYSTKTFVRMPPRGVHSDRRVIQRGCTAATRSSRIWLVTRS